ncbi:hypothetical protein ScPMuIL_013712 [Solemya velum]
MAYSFHARRLPLDAVISVPDSQSELHRFDLGKPDPVLKSKVQTILRLDTLPLPYTGDSIAEFSLTSRRRHLFLISVGYVDRCDQSHVCLPIKCYSMSILNLFVYVSLSDNMSYEESRELLPCSSLPEHRQLKDSYGTIDSCKTRRLVDPTWRHYMIVPISFLFVSMSVMSYTVLLQYTSDPIFFFVKNETVVDISQISKCAANTSTPAFKEYENAQEAASKWNIYFALAAGIPAVFSIIIIGSYSDRIETLTKERKSPERSLTIHISNVFKFYMTGEKKWKYILAITAFVFIAVTGKGSVETLYQLNKPFCWTPLHIGVYSGVKGFTQDVLGVLLIKVFRSRCTDAFLGMVGAISAGGYSLLVGLARSDVVLYIAPVVGIGSTLPLSLTKAIASSMTAPDRQE